MKTKSLVKRIVVGLLTIAMVLSMVTVTAVADDETWTAAGCAYGYQGDGSVVISTDEAYDGTQSLYVSGRTANWNGVKWNIVDGIAKAGAYKFTAYVKGTPTSNGTKLGYTINMGNSDWIGVAEVTLSSSQWTELTGIIRITPYHYNKIKAAGFADVYPSASSEDAGDYYIDCVSLTTYDEDDMSLCGVQPYSNGGNIERVTDVKYEGFDSILSKDRVDLWNGLAWYIPAGKLEDLYTNRNWNFYMYGKSQSGDISVTYNLEFWYTEGANKYLSVTGNLNASSWTYFGTTFNITDDYLTNLDHIVVYPYSSTTGNYYIDKAVLFGADDMSLCGVQPYNQGGYIYRTIENVATGNDAVVAAGRTEVYHGVAWYIPAANLGELGAANQWRFILGARVFADSMNLMYNFEFHYDNKGNEYRSISNNIYTNAASSIAGVMDVTGLIDEHLTGITVYPVSLDSSLADYIVDSVSLVPYTPDDMSLCGVQPTANGGAIDRNFYYIGEGLDSIISFYRVDPWNGAAWFIPVANLGDLAGADGWQIKFMAMTDYDQMYLSYNLEFVYYEGENKYLNFGNTINTLGWTNIGSTVMIPEDYFTNLKQVNIYPYAETLYNYYIDDVSIAPYTTPIVDRGTETAAMVMQAEVGDSITATFFADIDPAEVIKYDKIQLVAKLGDGEENRIDATLDKGIYSFKFENIYSQRMGEKISGKLVGVSGESDTVIKSIDGISIAEYCDQLAATYSEDEKLLDFMANMLEFGSQCQLYAGWNVANLVNGYSWMAGRVDTVVPTTTISKVSTLTDDTNGKIVNARLIVANKISIAFTVETENAANAVLVVSADGMENKVYNLGTANENIAVTGNQYMITLDKLSPADYDKTFTAKLYFGDPASTAVAHQVRYSVNTYCAKMNSNPNVQDLTTAIFNYGVAAKAYLTK